MRLRPENLIGFSLGLIVGVWVFSFLTGVSSYAYGQTYRETQLPASEIFENMMVYVQESDFEKLNKTLQLIKPITQALDGKFSKNLEGNIQNTIVNKDKTKSILAVQRLISLDMGDLLSIAIGTFRNSPEKVPTKLKMAYQDYLILSPYIQTKSFSSDQKIKNIFRKAVTTSASEEELKLMINEIEKELYFAFPDLKF